MTTHKMSVFSSARDMFDQLDDLALTFGEVSSIAKRGDRLSGAAKDPVTVQLALEEFLPASHFTQTGAEALVLGSGGAGCALTHQLGLRSDSPAKNGFSGVQVGDGKRLAMAVCRNPCQDAISRGFLASRDRTKASQPATDTETQSQNFPRGAGAINQGLSG